MQQSTSTLLKNIGIFILALMLGGFANGALVSISKHIIPPPEGANLTTEEGLKEAMHLMQPKHFIIPFLSHAIGTLVGAFLATKFTSRNQLVYAMLIGLMFFIGGAMMVNMLPSPMWFNLLDLIGAYFPMALLGWWLAGGKRKAANVQSLK